MTGTHQSRPPASGGHPCTSIDAPAMPRHAIRTDVAGLAADTASSPVVMDWCWGEGRLQETFTRSREPWG